MCLCFQKVCKVFHAYLASVDCVLALLAFLERSPVNAIPTTQSKVQAQQAVHHMHSKMTTAQGVSVPEGPGKCDLSLRGYTLKPADTNMSV